MEYVERLQVLDTCTISDALDAFSLPGATLGLRPLWPVTRAVAGRVRTIRVAPRAEGVPSHHLATPLIEIAEPGDVLAIDNRGRVDVSCWGGILTVAALAKGIAGVVIDGACRDIGESEALGLPVFGRAVVPVSARGRIVQEAMDVPILMGTHVVQAHDYVLADENGTIFVRAADIARVLDLAEQQAERETHMIDAIRSGRSAMDVMHDTQFPGAR